MRKIYKILIVDDEKIVRDSYKDILQKKFERELDIEVAKSGAEAIEISMRKSPDIILMDINMPGIKGMEAIKEIKKRNSEIVFVVISAYDEFTFAQEAITLDVFQYVLKPVKKDMLINVVEKAMEAVKNNIEKHLCDVRIRERMEKVLPALEHNFIYSLLLNSSYQDEMDYYSEVFEYNEEGGYIIIIEFNERYEDDLENKIDVRYSIMNSYMFLTHQMKSELKCIVGPLLGNKVVVFIPVMKTKDISSDKEEGVHSANIISKIMSKKSEVKYRIGIGSFKMLENLYSSYEEAVKSLAYSKGEISHILDFDEGGHSEELYLSQLIEDLVSECSYGKVGNALYVFGNIFDIISKGYFANPSQDEIDTIKNRIIEIFAVVFHWALSEKKDIGKIIKQNQYIKEIMSLKEIFTIKNWSEKKIEAIAGFINDSKQKEVNSSVAKAIEIIDADYSKDITLEELAGKLFITPQYLSRLFKEKTGKSFSEYIIFIRINKAKELLKKNEMSIKEISYAIGYGDPNYFSRMFKKEEGVTPSEYIKGK